jgi:putative nucleotidyltransferase with HDIG domain
MVPTNDEAQSLLFSHVQDPYQRYHALMVATAVAGYARERGEDETLWWATGYLHDLDYDEHPTEHPGPSLAWLRERGYPEAMIHAIEAHANGFNGFTTKAESDLARCLVACDEICGIFYAYHKLNPIPFQEMKASSIKKRLREPRFAPGISREHIEAACAEFGVTIDEHVENLIRYFADLPTPTTP